MSSRSDEAPPAPLAEVKQALSPVEQDLVVDLAPGLQTAEVALSATGALTLGGGVQVSEVGKISVLGNGST